MKKVLLLAVATLSTVLGFGMAPQRGASDDSRRLLTLNHYVRVKSTVPSIAGQIAQLYVRERVEAGVALRTANLADRVVLFVHGAGTPAEVAFDVPHEDYSWMSYLAQAGFDVFSMDVTGYGPSTRPPAMNDPCNLSSAQQTALIPHLLSAACTPAYPGQLTTIASDHNDIGAVVDYIRTQRRVEKVSMIAWSLGGPRAGGFAAANPAKVNKLVLLAPAYNRMSAANAPASLPANGVPMNTQSRDEFIANWERQVGCSNQYDPAVRDAVWSAMMESDPVGATWGSGVRRAPNTTTWGWNATAVGKLQIPTLAVAAIHDRQVMPAGVRNFYEDLGSKQKILLDLGCSSHNAMWERNHLLLFKASLDWLTRGTVNGMAQGVLQMGY